MRDQDTLPRHSGRQESRDCGLPSMIMPPGRTRLQVTSSVSMILVCMYAPCKGLCGKNSLLYQSAPDLLCHEYQQLDQKQPKKRCLFLTIPVCYLLLYPGRAGLTRLGRTHSMSVSEMSVGSEYQPTIQPVTVKTLTLRQREVKRKVKIR